MPATAPRPDHVAFALRVHELLTASGAGDGPGFVWSPYSVACALGLVAAGAHGRTRSELTALLGADLDGLLAALDEAVAGGPELASRTALWVRDDVPVEPGFESRVRARPDSDLRAADFRGDPEGVRAEINSDVAKTTRGMISDLLTPGSVTADVLSILVNALWVKMRWTEPFNPGRTRDLPFHAPSGTRRAALMHRVERLAHARTGDWRMVSLPGRDGLVLDVLLPPEAGSRSTLDAGTLTALYRDARDTSVALALPRFDVTHHQELTDVLDSAGVRTVFTDAADLSAISPVPLKVDSVVHQARLRVDEKGAEGAAATAVMMMRAAGAMPPPPVPFVVDRPFLVLLRRRDAILFLGTVNDPKDPGPAGD
ncbi:serpin family protein [Actinorugispora endophytica]|uniref:Serpin B n=1 Tax=Actinorugispora endophytica TaxID=1605990 RepID=A0A4R6UTI7_9ACTN|nr:serpin family protein [Actinorugispora endophytica]TDQ49576.1 serpin B [Actinorugispora endophytica]